MPIDLDTVADFTWGFGHLFLLETQGGKFYVWSDPDYNGDNTIRPYTENPDNFTSNDFRGRDKGIHTIRDYCGPDVVFVDCN